MDANEREYHARDLGGVSEWLFEAGRIIKGSSD